MELAAASSNKGVKPITVRRNVERKILRFSLCIGAITTLIAAIAYGIALRSDLRDPHVVNLEALAEIHCSGDTCDASNFTTDPYTESPDYIVDSQTRYLLSTPGSAPDTATRLASLDFADPAFVARFRQPDSYASLDGERWRLFSRPAVMGNKGVEIIIGYAEKQPTKILEASFADLPAIDERLREEADGIASNLARMKGPQNRALKSAIKLSADGFTVVDASTGEVRDWGYWLPTFLPKEKTIPSPGRALVRNGADLDLAQIDSDGRLVAVSLAYLGDLRWLCVVAIAIFVSSTLVARFLSRKFLRSYFLYSQTRVPTLEEALRQGEGTQVEFKRALSDDEGRDGPAEEEFLKTVAAFANSGDGVIFVGIDDGGRVKGLNLDFNKRDRLERKIRQLVRQRIRPTPPVQITFQQVNELTIACVTVARGEALAYLLGGVIYRRYGSSDVQAQPADLEALVAQYAL